MSEGFAERLPLARGNCTFGKTTQTDVEVRCQAGGGFLLKGKRH
jgi:hypothetical protein